MDEYPPCSLDHSIPSLVALGIAAPSSESRISLPFKEQATLVRSDLPPIESDQGRALLKFIQDRDASALPCTGRDVGTKKHRFRVRTVERSLLLPPRRARLPDNFEIPATPAVLHSPFSPLSPVSPLYPDGLVDALWLQKHHELVPSVLLCFYNLTSDPTLATLHDNQVKTDVNNIRGLLGQSGYRSRLAVVLLSERSRAGADGVQERVENIRRGCGMDTKAFFLVPPLDSDEALERMAENMLATLYTLSLEYYRDLGRHARKKRSRGVAPQPTVPPTTGTSQTLSLAGWNVRYDFKSAVFAEYRLEMDVALRSYDHAYENLLSSDVLEVIPSWSPRFNEARMLADTIAVRGLRCLLWAGHHSAAVRRWQVHREIVCDVVERKGNGTKNYGWAAWEARWAVVMANLMEQTDIRDLAPETMTLFLAPEKPLMSERLSPWEQLHHTGYWYRLAARHMQARRNFAYAMPENDRISPGDSPASQVASKAFTYDTYMCPDPHQEYPIKGQPGTDHSRMIIDGLVKARIEFQKRDQLRSAAELSLECAKEMVLAKDWQNAVSLLRPLWQDMSYRAEGWLAVAEEVSWTLRAAASMAGEAGTVLAIDWELLNRAFTKRPRWHYDITKALEGLQNRLDTKPSVRIRDAETLSFLSVTFTFRREEGRAGQTSQAQLCVKSNAHEVSAPVTLDKLHIQFDGSMKPVIIQHSADASPASQTKHGKTVLCTVSVDDGMGEDPESRLTTDESIGGALRGVADLTMKPGFTSVFNLDIPLREAGEASANSLKVTLACEAFDLEHALAFPDAGASNVWYLSAGSSKKLSRPTPQAIRILTRPPKMGIKHVEAKEQYYTSEPIELEFELVNAEESDARAKLDAILFGESPPVFRVVAGQSGDKATTTATDGSSGSGSGSSSKEATLDQENEESRVAGFALDPIASSGSSRVRVHVPPIGRPSRFDLTLRVMYHLATDPATPILQTALFQINVLNPFEANYDLLPRLHPDPWPSLFDHEGVAVPDASASAKKNPPAGDDEEEGGEDGDGSSSSGSGTAMATATARPAKGLSQTWRLVTRYASFASEDLWVRDVSIRVKATPSTVRVLEITKPHAALPPAKNEARGDTTDASRGRGDDDAVGRDHNSGRMVSPKTIEEEAFDIVAQRESLDDRGASTLDVSLLIRWTRRPGLATVNTTTLPVPRFGILGPEPRVLATVSHVRMGAAEAAGGINNNSTGASATTAETKKTSSKTKTGTRRGRTEARTRRGGGLKVIVLTVVIENASGHFLTFGLGMEPSDGFAFSGAKQTTMHVLPASRRAAAFRLVPLVRGAWVRPGLVVRDKYFQKVLRVAVTDEGMRQDKDGFAVWVPEEEDDDDDEGEEEDDEKDNDEEDGGDDDEDDGGEEEGQKEEGRGKVHSKDDGGDKDEGEDGREEAEGSEGAEKVEEEGR